MSGRSHDNRGFVSWLLDTKHLKNFISLSGLVAYTYHPIKAIQRVGRIPRLEATESRHLLLI